MLRNRAAREEIAQQWAEVRQMQGAVCVNLFASRGIGGSIPHRLADVSYNVVMVWAYAVLHNALQRLRRQLRFRAENNTVGALMVASQAGDPPPLQGVNYQGCYRGSSAATPLPIGSKSSPVISVGRTSMPSNRS